MTDGTIYRIEGADPADFLDWRAGSGSTVEIYDVVAGSRRRKGVGRSLVRRLVQLIRSWDPPDVRTRRLVFAVTRSTNQVAQQFYEALHFRVVAVLRDFYQDDPDVKSGVDAVMYGYDVNSDRQRPV